MLNNLRYLKEVKLLKVGQSKITGNARQYGTGCGSELDESKV